ncbi:MAG: DUF222 domain-containing protein, partial [Mycobacterium sp.]
LNAMADTVCRDDPRSRGELRAAGFGAFFQGFDRLVCLCGNPDCAAAATPSKVGKVVIHVLAEQASIDTALAEAAAYHEQRRAEHHRGPADEQSPDTPADSAADAAGLETTDSGVLETTDATGEPWWATPNDTGPTEPPDPDPDPDFDREVQPWWITPTHAKEPVGSAAPSTAEPVDSAAPTTEHPDSTTRPRPAQCAAPSDPPHASAQPLTDDEPTAAAAPEPTAPAASPANPEPAPPPRSVPPAVTTDGTIIPTPLLAELIRTGATLTPLPIPAEEPEPHYRPSRQLRRFSISRDLLCRFPGCNRRAEYADLDHTIPDADGGPTHPSNNKVLCREHPFAKTFRGGPTGWRDEQLPDGAVIWTAPTGHSYLTEPTSILIFPDWDTTTAPIPPPTPTKRRTSDPGPTMPKRQRTRRQDREHHIKTERAYNNAHRNRAPPPKGFR